ncbi:MAG: Gfo/Idh/MocA family oxidoreductase [Capsulimonadaceae bacterium]|nr:Gfo/Idh/MocA family oxidoreductase [Capsulimonadaceae bacterium]
MSNIDSRNGVGFGIVGCGTISATHAGAIEGLTAAHLAACCDVVPERAEQFAKAHSISPEHTHVSLNTFLKDTAVDVVSVCTPSGMHAQIGIEALLSGRPTIVEKPMDISVAACNALNDVQRRTGLPLGVISQHRFDAASIQARGLVDHGALGRIVLVEAQIKWHRTQEYYDSGDWRGTWALDGGGALMNQGVHTVDLMRWLCGPVVSVYAVARTAAHKRIEVEDVVCATLTFANGAIGNLVASTAAYPGFPATLSLHGEAGSVVISGDVLDTVATKTRVDVTGGQVIAHHALQVAQGGTKTAETLKAEEDASAEGETQSTEWGDAHQAQLAEFVTAVRDKRAPAVDGVAGLHAVEVVCAVYESARTGKTVTL